jgi:hypothetical protein
MTAKDLDPESEAAIREMAKRATDREIEQENQNELSQ